MQFGENGTVEYSSNTIDDKTLVLFNRLIRKLPDEDIKILYKDAVNNIQYDDNNVFLSKFTNLIILCFNTRNCRGGKGERDIFYSFFELISSDFPNTSTLLSKLISHYGYFKDYFNLIQRGNLPTNTVKQFFNDVSSQLSIDLTSNNKCSLAAKWIPRESSTFYDEITSILRTKYNMNSLASEIMSRLTNESRITLKGSKTIQKYRNMISTLNTKIGVVEVNMCNGTWKDIVFPHVPSIALDRYKHSFDLTLTDKQTKYIKNKVGLEFDDDEAQLRLISVDKQADRLECKEHYIEFLTNGTKVNGSQIAIEKLVENILKKRGNFDGSVEDLIKNSKYDMLLAHRQFNSYVDFVWNQLMEAEKDANKNLATLNKSINFDVEHDEVMVDVSGSMSGTPMNAAIGLGLLFMHLRKKKNPDAEQSLITFSANPTFIKFDDCQTFPAMVRRTSVADWGMNTNFVAAFDMLMQRNGRNIKNATKRIIALSDMQIDEATGHRYTNYCSSVSQEKTLSGVETMYQTICIKWKAWYGLPDDTTDLPTIVFWNLKSSVTGSPVDSSVKGVIQISGYSASLVKMLLFGDELTLENENKTKPTPSEVLNKTLAAKEYDFVRTALGWNNNVLPLDSVFAQECFNMFPGSGFNSPSVENTYYQNTFNTPNITYQNNMFAPNASNIDYDNEVIPKNISESDVNLSEPDYIPSVDPESIVNVATNLEENIIPSNQFEDVTKEVTPTVVENQPPQTGLFGYFRNFVWKN